MASCPYCKKKLTKKPQRKTKCPHCGKPIYVRKGELLTEAEANPKKPAQGNKGASSRDRAQPASPDSTGEEIIITDPAKKPYKRPNLKDGSPGGKGARTSARKGRKKQGKKASKPSQPKLNGLQKLQADLANYAREVYKQADLDEGKRKLLMSVGALVLGGAALTALLAPVDPEGLVVKSATLMRIIEKSAQVYLGMSSKERKQLRAAINWLSKLKGNG